MGIIKHLLLFMLYGLLGALLVLVLVGVGYLEQREDLSVWHRAVLVDHRAGDGVRSFADYLALEARLFAMLEEEVVDQVPPAVNPDVNRYARGSLSSPERWPRNWNRSYELGQPEPKAGVLLLHGMSDSPYSLRALAEFLHGRGLYVLGLRYPGHGTAPSTLTRTTWEDLASAVGLAARQVADAAGDRPFYVVGYSTGAPLAVEYALRATADPTLAMPEGLVFFSPAMGITPLAALAPWQARLGRALGLEKMAWNTIEPEYDPFKYRSFPLNAAIQVRRVAQHVAGQLDAAAAEGRLTALPPVLSFQSVVDETIQARALLDVLYARLPARDESDDRRHALVVYDLNRSAAIEPLLARDPRALMASLLADTSRHYEFTLVSNLEVADGSVRAVTGARGGRAAATCRLEASWPRGSYSLSHIAIPFPPTDPLYGGSAADPSPGIALGNVVLRGESSALKVSPAGLLRQSYNPFYDLQLERVARFMGLQAPAACRGGSGGQGDSP